MKYQLIQNRLLENGGTPDFTRGTLEGDIAPSEITFYRLQCDSEGPCGPMWRKAKYSRWPPAPSAVSAFLPSLKWAGSTAMCCSEAVSPPRAVAFAHCGKALFEVLKYFGVGDIAYNQPKSLPYPTENPWG